MSIPFKKYVNIISGVGGGAGVRRRDLIGRLISQNVLISPDVVLEFTKADAVGTYFGTTGLEYKRAVAYFAYVSPSIASPKKLSFSRWSEDGNGAAVYGNNDQKSLATLKAIIAGSLHIKIGTIVSNVVAITFAAANSLADVATALQTKVQALAGDFATATVTYDSTGGRFVLSMPLTVRDTISIATSDVATAMGLGTSVDAINVTGIAAQTALDAFTASIGVTNNFATFLFLQSLELADIVAVAADNKARNNQFMFCQRVNVDDAVAIAAAVATYGGVGLTLDEDGFADQCPMTIVAATDYNKRNSVQNFMYRQFAGLVPQVSDETNSDKYDALRVNYYGNTSTAGQTIMFYQRGTLMGTATDPSDMNVYANEIWLKDYAGSQLMSLQLSVSRIPANDSGRAMILSILQPVITDAVFNGVISVGKTLTPVQKVFIEQQTGDALAWHTVESVGYILSVVIEPLVTVSGATEYKAVYTLIYSKDDVIRSIEGTHQLV